jgi:hypothetical protein
MRKVSSPVQYHLEARRPTGVLYPNGSLGPIGIREVEVCANELRGRIRASHGATPDIHVLVLEQEGLRDVTAKFNVN